jgi:hypothetical protein
MASQKMQILTVCEERTACGLIHHVARAVCDRAKMIVFCKMEPQHAQHAQYTQHTQHSTAQYRAHSTHSTVQSEPSVSLTVSYYQHYHDCDKCTQWSLVLSCLFLSCMMVPANRCCLSLTDQSRCHLGRGAPVPRGCGG